MRKTAKYLYGESERGGGVGGWVGGGVEGTPSVPPELFLQLLEVAEGQATLSHIQTPGSARLCVP